MDKGILACADSVAATFRRRTHACVAAPLEAASAAMSAVAEAFAVNDFFAADEDLFAEELLGATAPPADAAPAAVEARPVEDAATT